MHTHTHAHICARQVAELQRYEGMYKELRMTADVALADSALMQVREHICPRVGC